MKQRHHTVRSSEGPKGKTICLLPNILTTASLFSGFYSIVSSINGHFFHAAVAIIIAAVFDGLDGRVARLTGTSSSFGKEYDSLCDLIAFGMAPAILAYEWVLQPYGRYGWLAAFLYVATTALRLARFNTQDAKDAKKTFTGLPCPAAGGMIATALLCSRFFELSGRHMEIPMVVAVYALSYLMVSSIPYQSFKQAEPQAKKAFHVLVAVVLLIMVLATEPRVTLFFLALAYVLSGPLAAVYGVLARDRKVIEEQEKLV
ncbi:MAG: CDP-diacylglycerol--serine O-phosphatidyltransferase [Thermodesulfobacteriota bacterium]